MDRSSSSPTIRSFDDLVGTILDRAGPVRLVAVDGPAGAGKSTFARRLARVSGEVPVVPTDDFASWDEPISWWPRLLSQVIEPIDEGRVGRYQRYDWDECRLAEWITVERAPIVVIEGVTASRTEWSQHLAFSIWIHTARVTRLRRGLDRDGHDLIGLWKEWMAAEDDHFEIDRPVMRADLIVDGQPSLPHDPEREFVVRTEDATEPPV